MIFSKKLISIDFGAQKIKKAIQKSQNYRTFSRCPQASDVEVILYYVAYRIYEKRERLK